MSMRANRREFLKRSAVVAGAAALAGPEAGRAQAKSPHEKLNIAVVGVGSGLSWSGFLIRFTDGQRESV